jgi:hypothetical protein
MKCQNETVTVELKNGKHNFFSLFFPSFPGAARLPTRAVPQHHSFALLGFEETAKSSLHNV